MGGGRNGETSSTTVGVKYSSEKKEGTCSRGLMQSNLFVYNVFLLIASLIVGGLGIWSILSTEVWFLPLFSELSYPLPAYLLVGAGVIGLIAAMIGCFGIGRPDPCMLLIYIILLLAVFLLQVMAGTLAYLYRETAFTDLQDRLNSTFMTKYGVEADTTMAVDKMQREMGCCGSISFQDWEFSQWKITGRQNEGNKVPSSCCKTETAPTCGQRDHPSNIFYTGCIHPLADVAKRHLSYISIAGLGLCFLQLFGVVFATCLYIKLRDTDLTVLNP